MARLLNIIGFFLETWKSLLLLGLLLWFCIKEKFWSDTVMSFTCPFFFFAISLPILDYFGFSFVDWFRKIKKKQEYDGRPK